MEYTQLFIKWLENNYSWFFSLLAQLFVAYHVFMLSKKLTLKEKLEHNIKVKKEADDLIHRNESMRLRRRVYLINIKKYFTKYPHDTYRSDYTQITAEIKATRYNGIEFFESMPVDLYFKDNKTLTSEKKEGRSLYGKAFPVGVVPYEWIERIDTEGNEFSGSPLIFCHFKKRSPFRHWFRNFRKYPYKELVYYEKSSTFQKHNDPPDMEFMTIRYKVKS